MVGHPKFNYGDKVEFEIYFPINEEEDKLVNLIGTVEIIDKYGTFFDQSDVYYDVSVEKFGLFKHLSEKSLRRATMES